MISLNKTSDLWNRDTEFENLKSNIGPLCCWFWCFWFDYG